MRLVVGLLTCLSLGALAPALANDPAPVGTTPSTPSNAAAAPASGASTSASSASPSAAPSTTPGSPSAPSGQSATPGQTPPAGQAPPAATGATPTAAAKPGKPELTPAEKDLLSQGYKLEMRGSDKHFCRNEAELGSRFPRKVCLTPEQAAATKLSSQDFLNDVQRPSNNQPGR